MMSLRCSRPLFLGVFVFGLFVGTDLSPARAQLVRQANTTLTLPADLPTATGYTVQNALGSLTFSAPIAVRAQPGVTNRLFVVERGGTIQLVDLAASPMTKTAFLDLATFLSGQGTPLTQDGECGLLSVAFHPNYTQNGYIYVFYSFKNSGSSQIYQRVARFTVNGTPALATSVNTSTHLPLITQADPASNHNGGDMHFGPADGYLYISVGDGGGGDDQFNNARFINKDFFGAILRIDVDKKLGSLAPNAHPSINADAGVARYAVPPDNPFIGATSHHNITISPSTVRTEIWATGLRNPFRFSFDPPTGRLFVGDVGQNAWEEVDIITRGADAGWSVYEGNHHGPNYDANLDINTFLFPIYEYGHSGGDANFTGNVITGGVVYRGQGFAELFENYIFCDEGSGHIWALAPPASGQGSWTVKKLADNTAIVAFGADPRDGDVLLVNIADGQIKHLVRSGTAGTQPPATLSATGAFSNLTTLTPNPGIVAYTPNVSFWSDYAEKSRWFAIKNTTDKMTFSANGNWTFPTGQVWVKHFDLPLDRANPNGARKRIETRFLVKTASNVYGITYKWRADGSEADLVAESGETATITGLTNPATQTWRYPSRSECLACHTAQAGGALSFNTRQLNAAHVYGAQTPNQIQALSDAGYLTAAVAGVNNLPRFFRADETTQSLESRVRSYFAVNCVQCHQPGGAALGNWDARPTTPTDSANMINGVLVDNLGDSANRFVKPGDTAHSVALSRVSGIGAPRMPPLATFERNLEAESLLTQWIQNELPNRRSFADWQVQYFGSTTDPNAAANADADGDGRTNLQEWLENTDPKNANNAWNYSGVAVAGGAFQFQFTQPANRSALIEVSTDLQSWTLWDVPGNTPTYPATAQPVTISAPFDATNKFFRVRLTAP